jgi:predicted  nucleic acid-binding Zn-ribbon protein
MNQLDALESENEGLKVRMEDQRRREIDLQAQIEQLEFDLDMARRKSG